MEQSKSLGVYSGYFTPATRTVFPAQTVFATSSLGHADVPRRRIKGPAERRGVIRSAPAVGKLVTLGISAPGELSPTLRWAFHEKFG